MSAVKGSRVYAFRAAWAHEPNLSWVTRGRSAQEGYCVYCQCYVNVRQEGVRALLTHSSLESHKFIINYKIDGRLGVNSTGTSRIDLLQRAEILWSLHCAASGYPNQTVNNDDLFGAMFVDSAIAKNSTMGRSRMTYQINKGIKPYLLKQLLKPVTVKGSKLVLHVEESLAGGGVKCIDVFVRFWHEKPGKVANILIGSHAIKRYDSEQVLSICLEASKKAGLPLKNVVYVSTHLAGGDQTVINGVERLVVQAGGMSLIEIVPFNENVIYHAYEKMLFAVADWGLEDLVFDLRAWFSTCKQPDTPFQHLVEVFANEDIRDCNDDMFAENAEIIDMIPEDRYNTNHSSIYRYTLGLNKWFGDVIKNWQFLVKYFQNYVPAFERGIKKVPKFQRLHSTLSNPLTLPRVWFARNVGNVLQQFLEDSIGLEGSSIHLVSKAVSVLIKEIGGRFLRREPKVSPASGVSHVKFEEREHQLDDEMINIGDPPSRLLINIPIFQLVSFYSGVRDAYAVLFGYLSQSLPLTDPVLGKCKALNPVKRTEEDHSKTIKGLTKHVPQLLDHRTTAKLLDEWAVYQKSDIEGLQSYETVEQYWDRVFRTCDAGGKPNFVNLSKLVQVMLCIYYKPDIRGYQQLLSLEQRQVTHVTQEFLAHQPSGKVSDVPMTDELISAYHDGLRKYSSHYENAVQKSSVEATVHLDGRTTDASDVAESRYHQIRGVEFLCSEGVRQINEGIEKEFPLEVNGGIALIEEAREQLREIKSKITRREHIRDINNNNRLLAAGLYSIKQGQSYGKENETKAGLNMVKWGLDGMIDLMMDLRPDSTATQLIESFEEEPVAVQSECRGCFK